MWCVNLFERWRHNVVFVTSRGGRVWEFSWCWWLWWNCWAEAIFHGMRQNRAQTAFECQQYSDIKIRDAKRRTLSSNRYSKVAKPILIESLFFGSSWEVNFFASFINSSIEKAERAARKSYSVFWKLFSILGLKRLVLVLTMTLRFATKRRKEISQISERRNWSFFGEKDRRRL